MNLEVIRVFKANLNPEAFTAIVSSVPELQEPPEIPAEDIYRDSVTGLRWTATSGKWELDLDDPVTSAYLMTVSMNALGEIIRRLRS